MWQLPHRSNTPLSFNFNLTLQMCVYIHFAGAYEADLIINISFQHKWGHVCVAFLILLKDYSAQRLFCYRFLDLYIQGRTKQKPNILAKGWSEFQTSFRRSVGRNKWPTFNCLLNFSSTHSMIATTDSQPGANRAAEVGLIFTDWLSGGFGEEICLNPLTSRYFQIWGMPLPLCWSC